MSPPAIPSHSSMMITDRSRALLLAAPSFSVMLPAKDLLISSTIFLLRASEALNSLQEYFGLHFATKTLVVVLPMPGGPLMRAARAFKFSTGLYFCHSLP